MLQLLLIVLVMTHMITAFRPIGSAIRHRISLDCATGPARIGSSFTSPASIGDMMYDIAVAIEKARDNGVSVGLVDLPIPVTGGTELDDWPGGIRQKYDVLYPMLVETMKALNFTSTAIKKKEYLRSKETGEDGDADAVGIWSHDGIYICTFPTPEYIPAMIEYTKWADAKGIFIVVNQQFFLDPMSKEESKDFQKNAEIVYKLESLNMRGPGALPVRGVLYRQYPSAFKACRRLDQGGYTVLQTYDQLPTRMNLETVFMEDSKVRDKDLSFLDRIKKAIPKGPG